MDDIKKKIEDTFTQEDEHTDMLEKEVIKELNTYTIKVTETKKGNCIKLDIETEGKATPTIKAHILELLLGEMVLGKFRSHDYDKELLERFVSYLREMHRVGFNYPVVDEFIESELKNE